MPPSRTNWMALICGHAPALHPTLHHAIVLACRLHSRVLQRYCGSRVSPHTHPCPPDMPTPWPAHASGSASRWKPRQCSCCQTLAVDRRKLRRRTFELFQQFAPAADLLLVDIADRRDTAAAGFRESLHVIAPAPTQSNNCNVDPIVRAEHACARGRRHRSFDKSTPFCSDIACLPTLYCTPSMRS